MLGSILSPVVQLDRNNLRDLEQNDYVVGPKADGERAVLQFQSSTGSFFLLRQSCPPTRIEGAYTGAVLNDGFLLDTEVVIFPSGTQLILAFDVCAPQGGKHYVKRRNLLNDILRSVSIPNLHLKPIAPAHQAESMWEIWQHCQYPIDGLIFTPVDKMYNARSIKWKPQSNLTLDIALGEPFEENESDSCFVPCLFDCAQYTTASDVVNSAHGMLGYISHVPFCTLTILNKLRPSVCQNPFIWIPLFARTIIHYDVQTAVYYVLGLIQTLEQPLA